MTKRQRIEHKQENQRRRKAMLAYSKGRKARDGNLVVLLGGVIQAGKYSK